MQLDEQARDYAVLFDKRRGLFMVKRRLLLLVGEQLTTPDGVGISASRVFAKSSRKPAYDPEAAVGWRTITFGAEIDWSIAGAEDDGDDN
jgi:hypothetical protein